MTYTDDGREALTDELSASVAWMKRTGNFVDADRVMRAIAYIRNRRRGPITDEMVEAGSRASFDGVTGFPFDDGDDPYRWDQKVVEDPVGADHWRADTRRILEAAFSVQEQS